MYMFEPIGWVASQKRPHMGGRDVSNQCTVYSILIASPVPKRLAFRRIASLPAMHLVMVAAGGSPSNSNAHSSSHRFPFGIVLQTEMSFSS